MLLNYPQMPFYLVSNIPTFARAHPAWAVFQITIEIPRAAFSTPVYKSNIFHIDIYTITLYIINVNVIALRTLKEFWERYPQSEDPLRVWYKNIRSSRYENLNRLRGAFPHADIAKSSLNDTLVVFNIGGNDFRLVVVVRYVSQTVFIKRVMTHEQYTLWNKKGRPS
jgi:mRNA interferase HigB